MNRKKLLISLTVLILSVAIVFALSQIKLGKIHCYSKSGECSEKLKSDLRRFEGRNLFRSLFDISGYLRNEKTIESFSSQFKLPNNVEVRIIDKTAVFSLKYQGKFANLDRNGTIQNISDESNLPCLVNLNNVPDVGETVDPKVMYALDLLGNLNYLHQTKEMYVRDGYLEVELQGRKVYLPWDKDKDLLIGSLEMIISQLNTYDQNSKIEDSVKIIDLRYKNPVLR